MNILMHLYITNFSIRILEQNSIAPFDMKQACPVLDLKSDTSLLNPNASVILADPFLFVRDGTLYLFYEHLTRWFGTGRICMRSTRDLKTWTEEKDVLAERFHLSFPFVFEDNGRVYMLPETGEDKSISLYEAKDNSLTSWRLVQKLLVSEIPWYDSIIYKKDGFYYLFTGHDDNVHQEQHLFVSENLIGPYMEHPMSPVYEGRDGGRNAGCLIEQDGALFRPVQVCINSYGEQTSIMKIEEISPTRYKETIYKNNIFDTTIPIYKEGGHQWNSVSFLGKRVVATDYREINFNIIEFLRRVKYKFIR